MIIKGLKNSLLPKDINADIDKPTVLPLIEKCSMCSYALGRILNDDNKFLCDCITILYFFVILE